MRRDKFYRVYKECGVATVPLNVFDHIDQGQFDLVHELTLRNVMGLLDPKDLGRNQADKENRGQYNDDAYGGPTHEGSNLDVNGHCPFVP